MTNEERARRANMYTAGKSVECSSVWVRWIDSAELEKFGPCGLRGFEIRPQGGWEILHDGGRKVTVVMAHQIKWITWELADQAAPE